MNLLQSFSSILSFWLVNVASVCASNRPILYRDGEFNARYADAVIRGVELIYGFDLPDDFNPLHTKIRVILRTDNATTTKLPLFATIHQTHFLASLQLPLTITDSNSKLRYFDASRTICIQHAEHYHADERHFDIRIVTSSARIVLFELEVLKLDAMNIGLDHPVTITISPTTPDFFYFQFPAIHESEKMHVKITVTSPYKKCSVLSIQPALCPVPDHAENVRVAGNQIEDSTGWEWETLTTKGAIVTSNKLISTSGFFIALLVTKDGRQCGDLSETSHKNINLTTELTVVVELDQLRDIENFFWTMPVYLPIAINFGILLISGLVCIAIQLCCKPKMYRKNFVPTKRFKDVLLSEFNQKFDGRKTPSACFGKMIIIIAIFYAIPVFELTIYNVTVLHRTGDNDICYFNSFCAHPFGYLKDFNHLWSNMCYIILGFGFICITYLKDKCTQHGKRKWTKHVKPTTDQICETNTELNPTSDAIEKGILFKTGLYYAMGVALALEGVFSTAYHICPNRSNFQFDTSFMFMIATMCILKIFDFRHPKNLGPNGIFTILALFSLLSASGIIMERYQFNSLLRIFKICLLIVQMCVIVLLSVYTLYVGYPVTVDKDNVEVILSSAKDIPYSFLVIPNFCRLRRLKLRWHRLISVILFWIPNILLALNIWASDFATLLVNFLIANLGYYLLHYVLIKLLVHREFRLNICSLQPLVYLAMSISVFSVAFLYFKVDLTEWRKSAAYSREGNGECVLWNFYDQHDIWHMYSAVAIFFFYMTLLTMDDGVQDIPQNELKLI